MLIKACLTLKIPFTIRYEVENKEEDDIKVYEVINENLKFNVDEVRTSTAKIPMPHKEYIPEVSYVTNLEPISVNNIDVKDIAREVVKHLEENLKKSSIL